MSTLTRPWSRQPGESPQEWLARLEAVDRRSLTDWQRMALARSTVRARRLAGRRPAVAPQDTPALREAKGVVRGLSRQERGRLVLWMAEGMPEGEGRKKP